MDKLPENIDILDFYQYSDEISEGAVPFLKYDPQELNSQKLINRIKRIYDL